MFNIQDFPIGSYFYWVRECGFKTKKGRIKLVVFTKMQVHEINDKGLIYYYNNKGTPIGCLYEHEKYLKLSTSMIIPGYLFEAMKNIESSGQFDLTATQEITKILKSTGNFSVDQMIFRCKYSFKEVNDKINPNKKEVV